MSDDDRRVNDVDQEWTLRENYWEKNSRSRTADGEEDEEEEDEEEEAADLCELAPHSAMSVGAGRVDSPSPQDIRLLHDLVEDLSKEQEDRSDRPRAEQVSRTRAFPKVGPRIKLCLLLRVHARAIDSFLFATRICYRSPITSRRGVTS